MTNPYGIEEVTFGGLAGAYDAGRQRRMQEMLLRRQEQALEREQSAREIFARHRPAGGARPAPAPTDAVPGAAPVPGAVPPAAGPAPSDDAAMFNELAAAVGPEAAATTMRAISQMDEGQRSAAAARNQAVAPLYITARQMPYEQRRAYIQSVAPQLQQMGVTPEQLAGFDPSDANLDSHIAVGMTVAQALDQTAVHWQSVGPGGAFATNAQGMPVVPGQAGGAPPIASPVPGAAPANVPAGSPLTPPTATPTGSGGFDAFYNGFLAPAEGGFVASDGRSGAPANFGVNQAANPDIDVRSLTQDQARQIMHDRYWVPSGADRIQDPALQAVHADTAVNMGVGAAQRLLQESGNDPQRYLQLREARYREIGGDDLPGWLSRNERLAAFVGGSANGTAPGAVTAQAQPSIQEQAMTGVIRPQMQAPPGMRYRADGGLEPIPGSQQDFERRNTGNTNDRQSRAEVAQIRQQFRQDPEVRQFRQVRVATEQIRRLASSATAANDMGLIFSFMRALDPSSTVREGEFATAQNAAGWGDRIRNMYNAAQSGTRLSPTQRREMTQTANQLYLARAESYNEVARQYHDDFRALGITDGRELGRMVPLATGPMTEARRRNERAAPARRGTGQTSTGVGWRIAQ